MAKPADTASTHRYAKYVAPLVIVVAIAYGALFIASKLTAARVEHNERAWFEAQINALVPAQLHDNDILTDHIEVVAPEALGTKRALTIYRARRQGMPTAAVINAIAPDGYGGPIQLLIAVDYAGAVLGVHVLSHHETPGIGDVFQLPGAKWLDAFRGHSLNNPDTPGWNIRKDGGDFEQFTSATITPRAIVKAVQRTLDYYQQHRDKLFTERSATR